MPAQLSSQHIHEIASVPRPLWSGFPDAERISDHIARSEGFAEASGGSWGRGVYSLFDDMEDKDPHLFSVLQTRKFGVLARLRKVEPASPSTTDRDIARWLEETLARLDNWDGGLMHLLGSLSKGMAVLEVICELTSRGTIAGVHAPSCLAGIRWWAPGDLEPTSFGSKTEPTRKIAPQNICSRSFQSRAPKRPRPLSDRLNLPRKR